MHIIFPHNYEMVTNNTIPRSNSNSIGEHWRARSSDGECHRNGWEHFFIIWFAVARTFLSVYVWMCVYECICVCLRWVQVYNLSFEFCVSTSESVRKRHLNSLHSMVFALILHKTRALTWNCFCIGYKCLIESVNWHSKWIYLNRNE